MLLQIMNLLKWRWVQYNLGRMCRCKLNSLFIYIDELINRFVARIINDIFESILSANSLSSSDIYNLKAFSDVKLKDKKNIFTTMR